MTASTSIAHDTDSLLVEIAEVRQELAALRRDSAATLKMLAAILRTVQGLARHEAGIEHSINDIAKEISGLHSDRPQTFRHCPHCGAPLEHHAATTGDLCICAACGWSQFVDREEGALPAAYPETPPAAANAPSTWVE